MTNKIIIDEKKIEALRESIQDTDWWLNFLKLNEEDQKEYDKRLKEMNFDDDDIFDEDFFDDRR